MFIYFILNTLTGKYYVGQTQHSLNYRWQGHIKKARQARLGKIKQTYLYKAISKYGPENFEIRPVFRCQTKEQLDAAEIFFIGLFDATNKNFGYNCTFGGHGGSCTQEVRDRISDTKRGKKRGPFTLEHRENISRSLTGRKRPLEDRLIMSRNRKGKKFSSEVRANMSRGHLGKKLSEDHKRLAKEGKERAKKLRELRWNRA